MAEKLSADYWNERYVNVNTPWDIGDISTPLKNYFDGLVDKEQIILIPGAGKAHEAIYLHRQGFSQVYVCDWAASAFDLLKAEVPDFPEDHLLIGDFFDLELRVDLVVEQTFFCAIDPSLRSKYIQKMGQLLREEGKLVGLLFAQEFNRSGPPFGGTITEYRSLFGPHFDILHMDIAPDSIKPRLGNEVFILLQKR